MYGTPPVYMQADGLHNGEVGFIGTTFDMINEASMLKHPDDLPFLLCLWRGHHEPIAATVCAFLGDDPDVSGGTIGEPKEIPPYVNLIDGYLRLAFFRSALVASPFTSQKIYNQLYDTGIPGPINAEEIARRVMARYLYYMEAYTNCRLR